MAIKISSTEVINSSRALVNVTGADGVYSNFAPSVTAITSTLNFNNPVMTLTMSGNVTFSESNKDAGKTAMFLLDTSSSFHTPQFSSNIKWKNGIVPSWGDFRYWQIILQCIDSTTVRGLASGFEATGGGGGGTLVQISNNIAENFSQAGLGGTATATYRLGNDGQTTRTLVNGSFVQISGEWLVSGSASDYEVYGTWSSVGGGDGYVGGGTVGGATPGTWLSLGTTRDYTLTETGLYAQRGLTLQIRDTATSTVRDTAVIAFEVDAAP
jgi:hypothetical protein